MDTTDIRVGAQLANLERHDVLGQVARLKRDNDLLIEALEELERLLTPGSETLEIVRVALDRVSVRA